jgi:peptidoglycan/xylan/chitin deacetylase (PgdA/CDA1 family)
MPRPPDYGIIYNWDGAPHSYSEYPQTMEQFLDKAYAVMQDTQVGAHFWSVGGEVERWRKDDVAEREPKTYGGARHFTGAENLLAMYERGEDPHEAMITRGHELGMHVYASVRMNDNHFSGLQPEDMARSKHRGLTQFRRDHPEYLIGDRTTEWFALSYDFSIAEVRQRRFDSIVETCNLYDWDGVELDWQRHAFHFDEDYAYRFRYTLTDLQRAVRRLADEISERRGKPFYVAARVNGYLEMCANIGYDIPTWVDEGLVDILIPAGGAASETEAEVAKFKELCEGTDVVVYPGFDSGIPGVSPYPEGGYVKDQMMTRAISARHYAQGADGIYVFNWHANGATRRDLLSTIGSPETLRQTDKVYAATNRHIVYEGDWRGAYRKDRLRGTVPVPLRETITGDGPMMIIEVADDLNTDVPSSLELRVRLQDWLKGDEVRIEWDGDEVTDLDWKYENVNDPYANQFASPVSDVSDVVWLSKFLSVDVVTPGTHQVKVALVTRNPLIESDIVVTDVELVVRFAD